MRSNITPPRPTVRRARAGIARRGAAGATAPRQPQQTRQRILKAAIDEFAARGLGGARVDTIARRARANKRMLYHYFGGKEDLYLAALERVYADRRASDRTFNTNHEDPRSALRALIRFNFEYFEAHPEFTTMLNNENLCRARYLARSARVPELHSPLIERIHELLRRGEKLGLFRSDVDPVQLYISITALGYFYFSNRWTLSCIFERRLDTPAARRQRREHIIDVILGYLRPTHKGG